MIFQITKYKLEAALYAHISVDVSVCFSHCIYFILYSFLSEQETTI